MDAFPCAVVGVALVCFGHPAGWALVVIALFI